MNYGRKRVKDSIDALADLQQGLEVFKKGERYWLELLSNGDLCGRSDNIKGVVINYFPFDQFYDIFTLSMERV